MHENKQSLKSSLSLTSWLDNISNQQFVWILIGLVVLLYSNSINSPFIWDDRAAIVGNNDVKGISKLSDIFQHDFWGQDIQLEDSHKSYRPLTVLTFRFDHNIYGLNAFGYHLTNIFIYALSVIVMFWLSILWINPLAAKVSTFLFVLHPVHVEAVTSIVGRADCLCGVFYFLALVLYTYSTQAPKGISILLMLLSFISALLGSFAKEIGITVFPLFILLELIDQLKSSMVNCVYFKVIGKSRSDPTAKIGFLSKHNLSISFQLLLNGIHQMITEPIVLFRIICSISIVLIFFRFRIYLHGRQTMYEWTILENHIHELPSFDARLLSYAQTHFWYFIKLVYPRYLCFDYGFDCIPTITSYLDWRNLLPLSVYGLFFGSLYSMFYYFKLSLILSFGCFFLPLLPALNIVVPVGTVLAERLLFVPSMGFCLILGQLIVQYCEPLWITLNTNIDSLIQKLLITSEASIENDEDSLHNFTNEGIATPAKKPSKANDSKYLNNKTPITKTPNLKRQLFASPKQNPLQSLPTSDSSKTNIFDSLFTFLIIIAILCSYRVITRNIDWKSEYNIYSSALEVCPRSVKALSNYALLASNKLETNQALNASMKAVQLYPMHSAAWVNAGVAQLKLSQYSYAIYDFEKSVSISPRSIKSAAYMGQTLYSWAGTFSADSLYKQELLKMSIYWINMSITNGFCSPSILHIAGSAFYETRNYRSAIEFYNKAINMSTAARIARGGSTDVPIEDDIHIPFAYNQIGNLYSILLDYPSSIESYLQGLALDPKNVAILTNIAVVYRKMKNDNEARKHLLTAIELSGNSPPAALLNNLGSLELDNGNLLIAKEYYSKALQGIQASRKYSVLPNANNGQAQVEYRNDDSFGDVENIISTNLLNVEQLIANSKK